MSGGSDHREPIGIVWDRDFQLSVRVRTGEQLAAALAVSEDHRIERIYAELPLLLSQDRELQNTIKRIVDNDITIYAALPYMLREEKGRNGIDAIRRTLDLEIVSGALVRNLEEAAFLKETGYQGRVRADQALAPWNRTALAELFVLVDEWTISPELNYHEIAELLRKADGDGKTSGTSSDDAREGAELIVYGRAPMMVSAGCVRRTNGRCKGSGEGDETAEYLTDRKGMRLPVITDCMTCCNVICNAVPLSLAKYRDRIRDLGIARVRFDLTTETGEETKELLTGSVPFTVTAGRFGKGVE